ncbi:gamma-glutamylcyclotransferase family protein [Gymnodinialimonas sp.]
MNDPYFFGYGSLVNRKTHAYPQAIQAHVTGWRRTWKGTVLREVAYLTAEPDSGGEIAGLIAAVPGADWAALDVREAAYARHGVGDIRHGHGDGLDVQIYAVEPQHVDTKHHPILLSYLDTVIQGYLAEFGEAGAQAFFETTGGWHHPIRDDRAAPIYPRATELTRAERAFVDRNLARVGAR